MISAATTICSSGHRPPGRCTPACSRAGHFRFRESGSVMLTDPLGQLRRKRTGSVGGRTAGRPSSPRAPGRPHRPRSRRPSTWCSSSSRPSAHQQPLPPRFRGPAAGHRRPVLIQLIDAPSPQPAPPALKGTPGHSAGRGWRSKPRSRRIIVRAGGIIRLLGALIQLELGFSAAPPVEPPGSATLGSSSPRRSFPNRSSSSRSTRSASASNSLGDPPDSPRLACWEAFTEQASSIHRQQPQPAPAPPCGTPRHTH